MSSFTSSPSQPWTQTQSSHPGHVYSSGCIVDGKPICACDQPAPRFISRTLQNPDRPFYKCATRGCLFWKWESDLLGAGLVPPTTPTHLSPSQTRKHRMNPGEVTPPSTPPKKQHVYTAPMSQTPERRRGTQGSGAGQMSMSMSMTASGRSRARELSPGARARRLANIEAGLRGPLRLGMDERGGSGSGAASVRNGMGEAKRKEREPEAESESDEDEDEKEKDEYENVTVKEDTDASSTESSPSQPASKRTRLSTRTERERLSTLGSSTPSPSRRRATTTTTTSSSSAYVTASLLTPSQTSARGTQSQNHEKPYNEAEAEEEEDPFSSSAPVSPTSFTRGGQRALEKAALASGLSLHKAKPRTSNTSNGASGGPPQNTPVRPFHRLLRCMSRLLPVPLPLPLSLPLPLPSPLQSFQPQSQSQPQSQLASRLHPAPPTPPSTSTRIGSAARLAVSSPAAASLLDALEGMDAQRERVGGSFAELLRDVERMRRKEVAMERSLELKDNRIMKLTEENERLKERNELLESFRDQIQNVTQATQRSKS